MVPDSANRTNVDLRKIRVRISKTFSYDVTLVSCKKISKMLPSGSARVPWEVPRSVEDDERTALLAKSFRDSLSFQRRRRRQRCIGVVGIVGTATLILVGLRYDKAQAEKKKMSKMSTASSVAPWFFSNQYYYEGAQRHYYRGNVVRAACGNNDDDAEFLAKCPANDQAAWCAKDMFTGPASNFHKVCAASCEDADMAWAMVCAWQAIANLEDVCAGTFVPTPPARSRNAPNSASAPTVGVTDQGGKLYGCDEHAVCNACFYGGHATSLGGEMCERVAAHYGGFGRLDEKHEKFSGYTGAESAFFALSELDKWCSSFDETKELTQRRDFGFVPAWVLSFGGNDGESGEYVQRWGHIGGERVEEHVVRDIHKHQERFASDAYAYWRYVLEADSEYDLDSRHSSSSLKLDVTTHVHTAASSLERALVENRVAPGAIVFVDVIYAMLDIQHFPGDPDDYDTNSLAALGWTDDLDPSSSSSDAVEDASSSSSSSSDVTSGDPDDFLASLQKSCVANMQAMKFCKHKVNKECVYQFAESIVLRSSTLRAILAYEKPLTIVVGGDLACRLQELPVTHHKLLFANDAALVSSVENYNTKIPTATTTALPRKTQDDDEWMMPRASWFPFGLEGVKILADPTSSALDADSSGARLDQWPFGESTVASKEFFLSLSASLNRRKPSRSTMYDWLVKDNGYDDLERIRRTATTHAGKLPNSVELTDNRPPFGKKGNHVLFGARPLDDSAEMSRRSIFSVAPGGDFWTSGRILESLMLGSIPVVDATYLTADGHASTKGCDDPAKFWRYGDSDFATAAPFIFVERWRDLPDLLEPFANNATLLTDRLTDLQNYRLALEDHLRNLPLALKRHLDKVTMDANIASKKKKKKSTESSSSETEEES